jgi:hypothetical protein
MALLHLNEKLYIFMTTSNATQTDDFWVLDVSDKMHPHVVASLETGGGTHVRGLLASAVQKTFNEAYVYVLENNAIDQLKTIDVHDPLSPTITDTVSLATYGVSPVGSNPEGRVITYHDGRLYIGLRTTIGPEFLVFDVRTNPAHPTFIGALPNTFDHSIYDIVVQDGFAYLAIKPGSPPSGLSTRELIILDVHGAVPRDTGSGFNATSSTNDTEGASTLAVLGNTLYMGRERVSNVAEKDFYAFDIGSSTRPTVLTSKRLGLSTGGSLGTPRIVDIAIQGNLGFFGTTDSTRGFQVYDLFAQENDIVPVHSLCAHYLTFARIADIIYDNDYVYIAHGIEPTVSIIQDAPSLCPS